MKIAGGNFWIATADEGLKRMDRQTGCGLTLPI
jgi:hypothetical protein